MMRPLTAGELADYLAGRVTYPGAVETVNGVMVPVPPPWPVTADTLNGAVEFDCPFTVTAPGMIAPADVYAPAVWDDGAGGEIIESAAWRFYSHGYTGQYGYRGPVMHPSEYLGGRLARDILKDPGTYVVTAVNDPEDLDALIGWTVLRLRGDE